MAPEIWETVRIMAQLRRNHGDSSTQFSIGHTFARSIRRSLLCPETTEQPAACRLDACPDKSQRTRLEEETTLRIIDPALSRKQDSITRLQFRIFGRHSTTFFANKNCASLRSLCLFSQLARFYAIDHQGCFMFECLGFFQAFIGFF